MSTVTLGKEAEEKIHDEMMEDLFKDETDINNRDPRFRYRLAAESPRRLGYWKRQGYEIVPWNDKAKLVGAIKTEEGGQQLGNNILMRAPLEVAERKIRRARAKAAFREGAIDSSVRENINKLARDSGRVPAHKEVFTDEA